MLSGMICTRGGLILAATQYTSINKPYDLGAGLFTKHVWQVFRSAVLMAAQHSHSHAPSGIAGVATVAPGTPKKNPPVAGAVVSVVVGADVEKGEGLPCAAETVADPKVKLAVGVDVAGTVVFPNVKLVVGVGVAVTVVDPKVKLVVGAGAGVSVVVGVEEGAEPKKIVGALDVVAGVVVGVLDGSVEAGVVV